MNDPPPVRSDSARIAQQRVQLARRRVPYLLIEDLDGSQRIVALDDEARAVWHIGRQKELPVALLLDEDVSRAHAQLERVGAAWILTDSSRNGTFVNGERLLGRHVLAEGDRIRVGRTLIHCYGVKGGGATNEPDPPPVMTPSEQVVLLELCRPILERTRLTPATNLEIAARLYVSDSTVKGHLRSISDKFEIKETEQNRKRAALATAAITRGAVSVDQLHAPSG